MQSKILVNPRKCVGCRICELICSLYHENEFNPAKSRIQVIKDEKRGVDAPKLINCDLCGGDLVCVKFCEPQAIELCCEH